MIPLYLVGTHHLDLKGPDRLEKFLGYVRPDSIGLESTLENFERRIQDHQQVESQSILLRLMLKSQYGSEAAENVARYLNMLGYELWVTSKFSQKNAGTKLICCDEYSPEDMREVTQQVFGNRVSESHEVTTNFIDEIAKTNFQEYQRTVDASYEDVSVEELKRDMRTFKALILDRDERTKPKIREAVRNANNALVYIGGTVHFFGDYSNLFERLKDLSPMRIKLPKVDKF